MIKCLVLFIIIWVGAVESVRYEQSQIMYSGTITQKSPAPITFDQLQRDGYWIEVRWDNGNVGEYKIDAKMYRDSMVGKSIEFNYTHKPFGFNYN